LLVLAGVPLLHRAATACDHLAYSPDSCFWPLTPLPPTVRQLCLCFLLQSLTRCSHPAGGLFSTQASALNCCHSRGAWCLFCCGRHHLQMQPSRGSALLWLGLSAASSSRRSSSSSSGPSWRARQSSTICASSTGGRHSSKGERHITTNLEYCQLEILKYAPLQYVDRGAGRHPLLHT
jgi:hypothetical protein